MLIFSLRKLRESQTGQFRGVLNESGDFCNPRPAHYDYYYYDGMDTQNPGTMNNVLF